jgi:mono/diheme cytochrome c family protein
MLRCAFLLLLMLVIVTCSAGDDAPVARIAYATDVQPIFKKHCYSCHGTEKQKSGFRLDIKADALKGGEIGNAIIASKGSESPLYKYVAGLEPDMVMPPKGERLSKKEVETIKRWIDEGANWPDEKQTAKEVWWSLKPIMMPAVPTVPADYKNWQRTPIDAFILQALLKKNLKPSDEADRRTLIRRVKYDLLGLPPTLEEVTAFVSSKDPQAYEKLVDQYLASPQYGERWARHWLDVVHYGETHGYDKDQPRPHAWPYRDYVIRAFNEDKPYRQFVAEQLAGDVLYPHTRDGIEALGFIAAGPWDFIGHAELPETKIDGKIARHLDRDDMVANTMSTFQSVTVHCAQCHNHKFDPIPAEDYYRLQAVFAAVDRTDKEYDADPELTKLRKEKQRQLQLAKERVSELEKQEQALTSPELKQLQNERNKITKKLTTLPAEYGYHSQISSSAKTEKWVQFDLGSLIDIKQIELTACYDDFKNIGAGFGFPKRYYMAVAEKDDFTKPVIVVDQRLQVVANPGTAPVMHAVNAKARYVRIVASELATRMNDYHFSLAEVRILDADGQNRATSAKLSALDSIEAGPRWKLINLIDGKVPSVIDLRHASELDLQIKELHQKLVPASLREQMNSARREVDQAQAAISKLPAPSKAYIGTVHHGKGNFLGTGARGKPRQITLLQRGNVQKPGPVVQPGALSMLQHQPSLFSEAGDNEGTRRAALARWITHQDNPLTWRSIVNRLWHYHFGQGLVETNNDFGKMGQLPTHPELLDWLAAEFRQHDSIKLLHRLIVNSAVYRQTSMPTGDVKQAMNIDSGNKLLWKMTARRLEAEALRDSILQTAGALNLKMGGPSYFDYVVEKPEHSPHYRYELKPVSDPAIHRRAIYRSIVRSQQNPWMATLDCADPSMMVDRRNQSISPLQSLAMLNDPLLLYMSERLADRLKAESKPIDTAFHLVLQRSPTADEVKQLEPYVKQHGLAQLGRLLWNLNEFVLVD